MAQISYGVMTFLNHPNESLDQEKYFKHEFGVGVGQEFEKMWKC